MYCKENTQISTEGFILNFIFVFLIYFLIMKNEKKNREKGCLTKDTLQVTSNKTNKRARLASIDCSSYLSS